MSKPIKMTLEQINNLRKDFEDALKLIKMGEGKINFSKSFDYINRKATLFFMEKAWLKMVALIREFDKEVAWHGVAKRGADPEKDEYIIYDIMVYPQEVTGATVNTDQVAYATWIMKHEDEVFNNIRMQGHSHVNMSTTPSCVDITHQEKILEQFEEDTFYIFLIWNKRNERTIKIYDMSKNVLFDTSDISVKIIEDDTGIESFIRGAKELVKEKSAYNYSGGKQSYNGYNYPYRGDTPAPTAGGSNKDNKQSNPITPPANFKTGSNSGSNSTKKLKGKRSAKHDRSSKKYNQLSIFGDYSEDPYGDYPGNVS